MPMPTFTWDHIHLRTPDPEAMAQWFERMFGAEIIRSTQLGKPRVDIKLGGAMIFTAQVNPGDGVNPAPTTRSPPISKRRVWSSPRNRTHPGPASRYASCAAHRAFRSNCLIATRNIPDISDL
jgi:catechol 2,3-dioxygenase-like lactoylglutathione lyase family enzyme